jgi:arylsulfatase
MRSKTLSAFAILMIALCFSAGAAYAASEKPNIVVIWGDDIGQSNISAYTHGLMGYKTPNIDRLAKEGMMFTDYYAENSCTGRASGVHHRAERLSHGQQQGRIACGQAGPEPKGSDDCRVVEATRLCDRAIRQEPPGRPQ